MDRHKKDKKSSGSKGRNKTGSTTSLGKRRSLRGRTRSGTNQQQQDTIESASPPASSPTASSMSNPKTSDYGSQSSPMRVPTKPEQLVKVALLGAAGGIGQPLSTLLLLHSEYVQHLALYDLAPSIRGVGLDVSHIDRQCKITTHLGPEELPDAVRGAKVIVVTAGLAQKPGMSRDDLFGSNAKIMLNIAKVCATHAPDAMLAIVSNPVNSLVPLTCEVYNRILSQQQPTANRAAAPSSPGQLAEVDQQQTGTNKSEGKQHGAGCIGNQFNDSYRRIFGVTTLDVIRASSLLAKSSFCKQEPNGLFKDPAKINVPVVGGHAGKTIMPLLSQVQPRSLLDKRRLMEDRSQQQMALQVIDQVQQAGIEVLNAKKGTGSATLSMAYAACRFTISLLRAQQGEKNIIECAYVRSHQPIIHDLDYFSTPLLLGKDGYIKSYGLTGLMASSGASSMKQQQQQQSQSQSQSQQLLPFEQQMIEEGSKELRTSVAKGEDFAREHLFSEK